MKNFPLKAEWIAEHRNGDKCYYYPGTGWISAHDGLVTGFDLADVPAIPEDATHVQFIDGKIQYVRQTDMTCVDIWRNGWEHACTLQKLPGTVVRIADGAIYPVMPTASVDKVKAVWVDAVVYAVVNRLGDTEVEVDYGIGQLPSVCPASTVCWTNVKRWRYAS